LKTVLGFLSKHTGAVKGLRDVSFILSASIGTVNVVTNPTNNILATTFAPTINVLPAPVNASEPVVNNISDQTPLQFSSRGGDTPSGAHGIFRCQFGDSPGTEIFAVDNLEEDPQNDNPEVIDDKLARVVADINNALTKPSAILLVGSADWRGLRPGLRRKYTSNDDLARARAKEVGRELAKLLKDWLPQPVIKLYASPSTHRGDSADVLAHDRAVKICILWN